MCQWNGSRRQNQQPAPLPLFQHCFLPLNVILVSYIFFGALTDTFSKHQLLSCEVTAEYNPPLIQPAPRGPQTQLLLCRDSQVKKKKKTRLAWLCGGESHPRTFKHKPWDIASRRVAVHRSVANNAQRTLWIPHDSWSMSITERPRNKQSSTLIRRCLPLRRATT